MAEAENQPHEPTLSKADAMALAEEAEAEAAEAEALAAAARARARAARLRRQAEAETESAAEATATAATVESAGVSPKTPGSAEPTATLAEPARRRRPRLLMAAALAVAVLAVCGLFGASGYMMWYHHDAVVHREHAAAFAAAARQGVINMLSLDFKKAKEDVQRVIDSSTGEFRDDFQKRAGDFTTVVEQSKVVTEGAVATTAVESMDTDSAVVLVLGTERVTNAAGAKDEPRTFRLRVSVARDADQLKLSKVEFVL